MEKTKDGLKRDFEVKAIDALNRDDTYAACLFDAGKLGFCLIEWKGTKWFSRWFNNAVKVN